MEKILYYDCFSGISGDMNLGAMIDLGVPESYLREELAKLSVNEFDLVISKDSRKGIFGTKVEVHLHEHSHDHYENHHHAHRHLQDIEKIVKASSLSENVMNTAMSIFNKIASAEAHVHGTTIDKVHFHEVGAVDSIVDIVGAAICFDYLKPDAVVSSPPELGGGFVNCDHGKLPVPAPATVEILKGIPVKKGATSFEMTTPTGAAILSALSKSFTDTMDFVIKKTGYGIGHRDTEIPNVLRVYIAERQILKNHKACLLECNIDDMSPEIYGYLSEKLISSGADDVYYTPIVMKKTRPAIMLSVLCGLEKEDEIRDIVLRETTTLGIRRAIIQKYFLDRKVRTEKTSLGEVRIKTGYIGNTAVKEKPEYEDCKRIAEEKNIPLKDVFDTITKETLSDKKK